MKVVTQFVLGATLALAALVPPALGQASDPDARVTLRVEDRELSEVVQYLREVSGANIVVMDGAEASVTLDLSDLRWTDALELACEQADCVVERREGGVLVVSSPPRVDFAFDNADITQVIDTIAKLSGANIIVSPRVQGTLTLRLANVPWRPALEQAVKTLGFVVVEEDRGILRVVDPADLEAQMETRAYTFRYMRPKSDFVPVIESEFLAGRLVPASGDLIADFPVIESLRKALTVGGRLEYIRDKNAIVVTDTAQVHRAVRDLIAELDTEPAQVFVDVKFVTTANSDLLSLGVDYGDLGPQATYSGGQIPITLPFNLGSGGFEDLFIASDTGSGPVVDTNSGGSPVLIPNTIFGALSFTQWAGTLRLLQRDSSTQVVQAPKLIALDGREATIFVGETIRYAEARSEQGQAGGLQLSVQEAGSSPVEVGFQLLVIPHVVPGTNRMQMDIIPKETTLTGVGDPTIAPPGFDVYTVGASGLEGTIALPRKRSSTIVTSAMLDSGQTAVVGGLTTDSEVERTSQVPFLSKLPLLGWLFEHEEKAYDRRSLLVFLTPTIVRTNADSRGILERELLRRRDDYSERIQEILYGDENAGISYAAADEEMGHMPEEDFQLSTFVRNPKDTEDTTVPSVPQAGVVEPVPQSVGEEATTGDQ
ncbi:MAG: hypothetical protein WD226_15005 [Planctomycetota bacterium]